MLLRLAESAGILPAWLGKLPDSCLAARDTHLGSRASRTSDVAHAKLDGLKPSSFGGRSGMRIFPRPFPATGRNKRERDQRGHGRFGFRAPQKVSHLQPKKIAAGHQPHELPGRRHGSRARSARSGTQNASSGEDSRSVASNRSHGTALRRDLNRSLRHVTQCDHNLDEPRSSDNLDQAACACLAIARGRQTARPTKSGGREKSRHPSRAISRPSARQNPHLFQRRAGLETEPVHNPVCLQREKEEIRGGEIFDRIVWRKRCRTRQSPSYKIQPRNDDGFMICGS